jgi:hypothetical protein
MQHKWFSKVQGVFTYLGHFDTVVGGFVGSFVKIYTIAITILVC